MRIKLISIMLAITPFLLFYAIEAVFSTKPLDSPRAVKGSLDLSGHELTGGRAVRLDGELEFVPNRLVLSNYFQSGNNYI